MAAKNQVRIVESLAREIWTEHYTPIIGREQVEYMLEKFQSAKAIMDQIKEGMLYYLIELDSAPIGYVAVLPKEKERELFLSKIYVRSADRGKGYGRKAMQFAESLAMDRGLNKIALTVNKQNLESINAYEKLGFRNIGSLVQDIGSGFIMDDYRLEKTVAR